LHLKDKYIFGYRREKENENAECKKCKQRDRHRNKPPELLTMSRWNPFSGASMCTNRVRLPIRIEIGLD